MTETPRPRIAVIIASTRQGRFGPAVAEWFTGRLREHGGLTADPLDLADYPLPLVMDFSRPEPEAVTALGERLAAADGFVVVTPEYNHSFPAALKNAVDWYRTEWQAKPVAFVSYGGRGGGLRAVEQLRQVFAELHATTVRDVVSLHNVDRVPAEDPALANAAKALLDQLAWWTEALREARARRPYAA